MRKALLCLGLCMGISLLKANDTLRCSGPLNREGLKHGVWICRQGDTLLRKERYKDGKLQTYIRFDTNGDIIETRNRRGKIKTFKPCGC